MNKIIIVCLFVVVGCATKEQKKEEAPKTKTIEVVCGQINIKGVNDPLEDAIVIDTTKYCNRESLYNNAKFLSFDFKKPFVKVEKEFSVVVYFADGDADSYFRARFLFNGELVNVDPDEIRIDEACDLEDKCVKRKGFMFSVKRDVIEFWAANGGTIRFGEKTDIIIDKNEVKDFLSVVDKSVVNL